MKHVLLLLALFVTLSPVQASFHFAKIVEVFTGSTEYPTAQYIVIMPYADIQNLLSGVEITVFDSTGMALINFATFASNLNSPVTNQQRILIATTDARVLFGVLPDQTATGALPSSGLVCFHLGLLTPDCISFGNYAGNTAIGGSEAGAAVPSVASGMAYVRDLGVDGILQALDDTNSSANDFNAGVPAPGNFAGARVSNVSLSGDVTLDWAVATVPGYTIHKTSDPATVRLSTPIAGVNGTNWIDPSPNLFPGLSCYVVKP